MTEMGKKLIEDKSDSYAREIGKALEKEIVRLVVPAIKQAYKDGYTRCLDEHEDFCAKNCKLWDSPFRCRDCTK